uniref:Uncharacterized protein n=1 Tax=Steinernema glaseri TaxID=37863 RepID=A0A1I7Z8Y7_9BILA
MTCPELQAKTKSKEKRAIRTPPTLGEHPKTKGVHITRSPCCHSDRLSCLEKASECPVEGALFGFSENLRRHKGRVYRTNKCLVRPTG